VPSASVAKQEQSEASLQEDVFFDSVWFYNHVSWGTETVVRSECPVRVSPFFAETGRGFLNYRTSPHSVGWNGDSWRPPCCLRFVADRALALRHWSFEVGCATEA
jgi:hypothetical protein